MATPDATDAPRAVDDCATALTTALTIDPEKAAKKAAKQAEKEAKKAKAAAKAARAAEEKARTAAAGGGEGKARREKKASGPSEEDARAKESALKTPKGEMKGFGGDADGEVVRSGGGGGGVVRLVGAVRDVYADDGDEKAKVCHRDSAAERHGCAAHWTRADERYSRHHRAMATNAGI